MTPILVEGDEATKLIDATVAGKEYTPKQITRPTQAMNEWVKINARRLAGARERGTLPYWLSDNLALIEH
jgi:hypothetical protein